MKKILFVSVGGILALLLIALLSKTSVAPVAASPQAESRPLTEVNKTVCIALPDKINFCGEDVPLNDQDVRERLDRELLINTYWQSQTLLIIKEYNKIKPLLEPVLKKYDMPEDFIFLAAAESGFKNVVSPSNAAGVWQIIAATAKLYGLEVNDEVDERYNFERATEAACLYLKAAHDKFGSWSMAACSYNMGMSNMETVIKNQDSDNYFNLFLNTESSRYVFRILALKEVISNPSKYGFIINETDLYQPYKYKTVKVDSTIQKLSGFAVSNGITYKELKILNPWLRNARLTNKLKKTYEIKIMDKG